MEVIWTENYNIAPFSIADAAYGSTFFMATGFLIMILIHHNLKHLSSIHHFGFEAAAWYWHFVDVVWLFLFTAIYWWGGYLIIMSSIITFLLMGPLSMS